MEFRSNDFRELLVLQKESAVESRNTMRKSRSPISCIIGGPVVLPFANLVPAAGICIGGYQINRQNGILILSEYHPPQVRGWQCFE